MKFAPRSPAALIGICFFVSGTAGLIYQVVWSRYLALFLGHTSYAVVAVLTVFMGGLAMGNACFGARADRTSKPLALYAWLEIGIGVYALFFPTYYSLCHDAFIGLVRGWHPGASAGLALKFLVSFCCVILPAILMGATFPVLTRFVTRSLAELRSKVAALYAINSAGAVLGCVVADFWWIPSYGLELTVYGAAALNLAVGVVALLLSLRVETGAPDQAAPVPADAGAGIEHYSADQLRVALLGIGLSGFVAMLYEVAWTRLLALALGSSTHAFSLMLVTFITGIAIGAWVVYRWTGLRRSLVVFGWVELALAATLSLSMLFYGDLPYWFAKLARLLARKEEAYPLYELMQALICFAVMLLPTTFLGMTLPLISRVLTLELRGTGRSVGTVFAVNTLGTVFGTLLTGLWLMPTLGLARTFALGIVLNVLIALVALSGKGLLAAVRTRAIPILAAAAAMWLVSAYLDSSWSRAFLLGVWRTPQSPPSLAAFREMARAVRLKFHQDGAGSTVDVYSWASHGQENLTLSVNGKADASTDEDMVTQLMLGHLPMLLRPQSRHALIIGLGSGMTCGAVLQHPSIERVDAVEISPAVVQAAHLFANFNRQALDDSKLHLAVEDAKAFLQVSDRTYDVIISEPSNPWMAGVAAVFSQEYYRDCAARLAPGGLVAQWMHVYETTDQTVDMVLRTFLSVFPFMSIWQPMTGDIILIGSLQPAKVDLEALRQRFAIPSVQSDLARVNLLSVPAILTCEIIPQQNGLFTVRPDGPVHSDLVPGLEYLAQEGFFVNQVAEHWRLLREDFSPRANTLLGQYLKRHPLTGEDFKAFAQEYSAHQMPEARLFRSLLNRWQTDPTLPPFPMDLWPSPSERTSSIELRAIRLEPLRQKMIEEATSSPGPLRLHAADLMQTYRAERSLFYLPPTESLEECLRRLIEVDPDYQRLSKLHLAEIAWDRGDDAHCLELGESALKASSGGGFQFSADTTAPGAVVYRMAESLTRAGKLSEAWDILQRAKASGYITTSTNGFPLADALHRKIQLYLQTAQGSPKRAK